MLSHTTTRRVEETAEALMLDLVSGLQQRGQTIGPETRRRMQHTLTLTMRAMAENVKDTIGLLLATLDEKALAQ